MNVPQISGAGTDPVAMKMVQPAPGQSTRPAAAGQTAVSSAPAGTLSSTVGTTGSSAASQAQSITARSSISSSSTTAMLMDPTSRSSNLALAFLILQILLQGDEDKKKQVDPLIAGLAAGLLAAQQSRSPTLFYSSSMMNASTEITISPQQVSQAYNTQMPAVAANPASSAGRTTGTQVAKVDMHA